MQYTIEELAAFLGTTENACVKALPGAADGTLWVLFVPGDYEVNEVAVEHLLGEFTPLSDAEMKDAGPEGLHGPGRPA